MQYQAEHNGHDLPPFSPSVLPPGLFLESANLEKRLAQAQHRRCSAGGARYNNTGPVNGGQLFVRSLPFVERMLQAMPAHLNGNSTTLDQAVLFIEVLERGCGRFRASNLPSSFAGRCWYKPKRLSWCALHTFHAHCLTSLQAKAEWMRHAVGNASRCSPSSSRGAAASAAAPRKGGGGAGTSARSLPRS